MVRALNLLGIAGTAYYTYASTDTQVTTPESMTAALMGYTWDLDGNGTIGDETFYLMLDFDSNGTIDNGFEGSTAAANRYYAVMPSLSASTACRLLLQIGPEPDRWTYPNAGQHWGRTESGELDDPNIGDYGIPPNSFWVPYPSCP